MSGLLVAIAIFVVVAVLLVKGVRTVSQGEEWVVERFGKYLPHFAPGLSFINPLFDRVAYRVITKDIVLHFAARTDIFGGGNAKRQNAPASKRSFGLRISKR